MGKIKFTKAELKNQQEAKRRYERFLPTLQLKKQQLQLEVRQSADQLEANEAAQRRLTESVTHFIALYGDEELERVVSGAVRVAEVLRGSTNIAGVTVPTFDRVEFAPAEWDLFATDWCVDDLVATLREAVSLRCAYEVLEEAHRLLAAELRSTTQRVNLFEKVKIPECGENIRRINIMLGDAETSGVARSNIAKTKSVEAA